MEANEQNNGQKKRGFSSQAGLGSFIGARRAPARIVPRKSLDVGVPAPIQSVPPEILNPGGQDQHGDGPGVTEVAAKGFGRGVAAGVQGQALDQAGRGFEAVLDGPLPGVAGPVVDALDIVQKKTPAVPGRPKVVMNPAHVASLAALDARSEEGLSGSGRDYGR
ncbi:hypothetical protein [Arthrobacter sp. AD-310]